MSAINSPTSEGSALARVESFQYPRAHYGHLTQEQQNALDQFKALCQQAGYYTPGTSSSKPSHDDETLLRYLRARKFHPQDALGQFKDTELWRKQNQIDNLYETIDIQEYDETRKLYPQWTGRRDKRGIPVYVYEVAALTAKRMSEYEKSFAKAPVKGNVSPKLLRLFALYENLTRFVMPLCSGVAGRPYEDTPISQSNNIVDISKVGLKQFWNLKGHMQDASQLATAHYPETLDRIFIIGAPSFFPTVWGWIKRWFDPITVSKIFILSQQDMKSTLEQYIDVDNIPKRYGGNLDWDWGHLPNLEPQIQNSLKWVNPTMNEWGANGFPLGPIRWDESSDGKVTAIAVGSEHGKQRKIQLAALANQGSTNTAPRVTVTGASMASTRSNVAPHGEPTNFGPPSTSGVHTHPGESVDYFPTSGHTPPPEEEEIPNAREGTSETHYAQQDHTHASGQLAQGTPATNDHGFGDKSRTMEPRTVGQAPKDVQVPEAQPTQPETDASYLSQAKSAAGSAAAALGSAGTSVLAMVGGKKEEIETPQEPEKPQDSRVDGLKDNQVEDFIRTKYATHTTDNSGPSPTAQ